MRADDPNARDFPVEARWDNTFIVGTTDRREEVAKRELAKLEAKDETIIITDPYLFCVYNDTQYASDLLNILLSLEAKTIKYCAPSIRDQTAFDKISDELSELGCTLLHDGQLTDCHDRFWLCVERKRAVVFGTSLNGLCKRICRVDMLSDGEVQELMIELQTRNILEE